MCRGVPCHSHEAGQEELRFFGIMVKSNLWLPANVTGACFLGHVTSKKQIALREVAYLKGLMPTAVFCITLWLTLFEEMAVLLLLLHCG